MKAIILAAGQGTRLKKYTQNLPKGMLEFAGQTIIERQINLFRGCGINEIVIIKGFAGDAIQYDNVKYYTNHEYDSTNMVESLLVAREEFNDDVIVSYSDIIYEKALLDDMINSDGDFVVSVDDNWQAYWKARYDTVDFDTESLKIAHNDNIISIGKENPSLDEIDARYIGLLKFSHNGLQQILDLIDKDYDEYLNKPWKQSGKNIRQAYMTDLLQALIDANKEVKAKKFNNGWIELDTNEDYELACQWVETGVINNLLDIQL